MDTPKNSTEGASPEVQPDDYQNEHKEASTAPTLTGHQDTDQSDITGILTQKNRTPAGPQNGEIEEGISLLQSKSDRFLKEGGKPISATAPPISPSCDVVRKKGIVVAVIKPQRWNKTTIFKNFIETKNGSGPLTRPRTRTFYAFTTSNSGLAAKYRQFAPVSFNTKGELTNHFLHNGSNENILDATDLRLIMTHEKDDPIQEGEVVLRNDRKGKSFPAIRLGDEKYSIMLSIYPDSLKRNNSENCVPEMGTKVNVQTIMGRDGYSKIVKIFHSENTQTRQRGIIDIDMVNELNTKLGAEIFMGGIPTSTKYPCLDFMELIKIFEGITSLKELSLANLVDRLIEKEYRNKETQDALVEGSDGTPSAEALQAQKDANKKTNYLEPLDGEPSKSTGTTLVLNLTPWSSHIEACTSGTKRFGETEVLKWVNDFAGSNSKYTKHIIKIVVVSPTHMMTNASNVLAVHSPYDYLSTTPNSRLHSILVTENTVHLGSWKDRKGGVDFKRSRNQSKLILYQFYPKALVIPFGTPRSEPTPNPLKLEAMDVDYATAKGGYGSSSEDFEHISTKPTTGLSSPRTPGTRYQPRRTNIRSSVATTELGG